MAHHEKSRFLALALVVMIAALRLCGCGPAPSQPSILSVPDTMMLVKEGSRFTYLEENYAYGKPGTPPQRTDSWVASRGGPDSAHTDSTIWKTTFADSLGHGRLNSEITFLYRKNGDVIMRRYFEWNAAPGYVDMVIPLSIHADIELPHYSTTQAYAQGSHQYTYVYLTRTTTCRYLGRDTIEVAGERMACEHGQVVIMTYAYGEDYPYGAYAIEYWFAPKIGCIAKERVDQPGVRNTAQGDYWTIRTLQSYDLK